MQVQNVNVPGTTLDEFAENQKPEDPASTDPHS